MMTTHAPARSKAASAVLDTPLGPLTATVGPQGLTRLAYEAHLDADGPATAHPTLAALADDLDRYFAGEPLTFSVPVDLEGVSRFARQVLCACAKVPYGGTTTYGELAHAVGQPSAARAVGKALGSNPVPIVVPCHRVLRGDGSLGGYSSGLRRKRFLLALEGKV